MDEPVDYAAVAAHLKTTQGLGSIDIPSAYHSNWLDNTRAKLDLNWRPRTDLAKLIDAAWTYKRAPDDPRKVWYSRRKRIDSRYAERPLASAISTLFDEHLRGLVPNLDILRPNSTASGSANHPPHPFETGGADRFTDLGFRPSSVSSTDALVQHRRPTAALQIRDVGGVIPLAFLDYDSVAHGSVLETSAPGDG